MNKVKSFYFIAYFLAIAIAKGEEKPNKLKALDKEFLNFIASMEKVEGKWLDPLIMKGVNSNVSGELHKVPTKTAVAHSTKTKKDQ